MEDDTIIDGQTDTASGARSSPTAAIRQTA
jgi:hypothetical protein